MRPPTYPAKILRPRVRAGLSRNRLFDRLDHLRGSPAVWVAGPAGSGKTTLINSYLGVRKISALWYHIDAGDSDLATWFYYLSLAGRQASSRRTTRLPLLTPEYLFGIPTFTRRFFELLCGLLKRPFALVFDNCQNAADESPLHEALRDVISCLPEGISLIMISRTLPPAPFAGARANGQLAELGVDELRFTARESSEFLKLSSGGISPDMADKIHEKNQGWAAGLVLLQEGLSPAGEGRTAPVGSAPEVFDYFATEVFRKLPAETRDFLMRTSVLPVMTVGTAEAVSERANAAVVLNRLNRENFFTEKSGSGAYRYHPLFREYLSSLLHQTLDAGALADLYTRAAEQLEATGQIEDAAELHIRLGSWPALMKIVYTNAPALLSQGRNMTVMAWIAALPAEARERTPWTLFWQGASLLPFRPRESRNCFEQAYKLFSAGKDSAGIFLAWAGVLQAIEFSFEDMQQLNHWIEVFEKLRRKYPIFPSPEIENRIAAALFTALVMQQPDHPDFEFWKQKALSSRDPNDRMLTYFHLCVHYSWKGDRAESREAAERMRMMASSGKTSPFNASLALFAMALQNQFDADLETCWNAFKQGMELSATTGMRLMDVLFIANGILIALRRGDLPAARELIRSFPSDLEMLRPWDRCIVLHSMAAEAYLSNDPATSFRLGERVLEADRLVGSPLSTGMIQLQQALTLTVMGEYKQAEARIVLAERAVKALNSGMFALQCGLARALILLSRGNASAAISMLRTATAIGARMNCFPHNVIWRPEDLARLCTVALENDIEPEYVRFIVRTRNLISLPASNDIEQWPWPVKVYTLGRFRLEADGRPREVTGKVQKKPLELLKLLTAMDGDAAEETVMDNLWPEGDGASARMAFKTTLHRLRQLIGKEEAVLLQDGRLRIDRRYCWTDVAVFEALLDDADKVDEKDPTAARSLREKAVSLYRGHFLPEDDGKGWTVPRRERLKRKFLRNVERLGENCEKKKEHRKAVEYYHRGLEVDGLAEDLYLHVMRCHLAMGRKAEAIKIYKRCREALVTELGVEPSEEMEALYAGIRQGGRRE